jgi:hypothetical protein
MKAKLRGNPDIDPSDTSEQDLEGLDDPKQSALLAKKFDYGREKLNQRIIGVFQQKVGKMVDAAAKDPESDAGEMVRILVLNKLLGMHKAIGQEPVGDLLKEERARADLMLKNKKLKRELRATKDQVRDTQKAIEEARRKNKPLTDSEIYNRIATAVGLRAPKQPAAATPESKSEGESQDRSEK